MDSAVLFFARRSFHMIFKSISLGDVLLVVGLALMGAAAFLSGGWLALLVYLAVVLVICGGAVIWYETVSRETGKQEANE